MDLLLRGIGDERADLAGHIDNHARLSLVLAALDLHMVTHLCVACFINGMAKTLQNLSSCGLLNRQCIERYPEATHIEDLVKVGCREGQELVQALQVGHDEDLAVLAYGVHPPLQLDQIALIDLHGEVNNVSMLQMFLRGVT